MGMDSRSSSPCRITPPRWRCRGRVMSRAFCATTTWMTAHRAGSACVRSSKTPKPILRSSGMRAGRFSELPSFGREWDAYSISRTPSFESLATEFMRRCAAAGIRIEAFHTELGHGMFEYTFEPQPALKAADDAVRAKLYLRQLCAERGLIATYMTAKFVNTGDSYCGCHHNFSLARGKKNIFWNEAKGDLSLVARHAAAGMLKTLP